MKKKQKFKEESNMCEALREIWAEDFERARSEGMEAGFKQAEIEGIRRMIISCRDFGVAQKQVHEKLVENYEVTETQAEGYIRQYW